MAYALSGSSVVVESFIDDVADRRAAALLAGLGITTQSEWEAWVNAATQAQLNSALRSLLKASIRIGV